MWLVHTFQLQNLRTPLSNQSFAIALKVLTMQYAIQVAKGNERATTKRLCHSLFEHLLYVPLRTHSLLSMAILNMQQQFRLLDHPAQILRAQETVSPLILHPTTLHIRLLCDLVSANSYSILLLGTLTQTSYAFRRDVPHGALFNK